MSRYIYLSSDGFKKNFYPSNNSFDFINPLHRPIFANTERWEVALTEIFWEPADVKFSEDIYVMSDIIPPEVQVAESLVRLLRIIRKPIRIKNPYYLPISSDLIENIRIYLRTGGDRIPKEKDITKLRCTLHFKMK